MGSKLCIKKSRIQWEKRERESETERDRDRQRQTDRQAETGREGGRET